MNPSLPNACFLGSGLELLLDEIYDTIFAGLDLASTFAETTLYRILQRRFLAVQLVISGRFRCEYKLEADVFPLTRFLCPWNSPSKNTGVGCHSPFQGIFLTQESNPGLSHCGQILYCLSHQGSTSILAWKIPWT